MVKELYQITTREISLNVTQTQIDSIRKKNITKSGCRVYKDGYIGIAGTLGEVTEDIWKEAEAYLERKIPYTYQSEKNKVRTSDYRSLKLSSEEFINRTEELLKYLREEFPDFIFSNKITLTETEEQITNSEGLNYKFCDKTVLTTLLVKNVDSLNIFDTGIMEHKRDFNIDRILNEIRIQLTAFDNLVDLPNTGKIPVIFEFSDISNKFMESLSSEKIGYKASIFYDKIGKKCFSDQLTMFINRTEENLQTSFFDMEGSVILGDRYDLIKDGIITGGYADKKTATLFHVPNTAAADGNYDDIPSIGNGQQLDMEVSGKTLSELLEGKYAILVSMMSGGDWTNEGDFASPVQMAYLYHDNKLIGRLPELSITGNLYKMFGEDFIGRSKDNFLTVKYPIVVNMNIKK